MDTYQIFEIHNTVVFEVDQADEVVVHHARNLVILSCKFSK